MRARLALTLVLVLSFASFAVAADIWVKAGANGKGKSKSKPLGYLWKAVDKAKRGDVIHVAQGTYNGKGGSGHFTVKSPNLCLVGGYNDDFSKRNPFKYFTILERAKDYRGDWTGLPEAIIAGDSDDHSNLTVDGFLLNGESRNKYTPAKTKILIKGCYKGCLFQTRCKNTRLLNSILLNPCGKGIYCTWQGDKNEISNCFILNTMYCGISTRSAQPDSKILIKNNVICFSWFYPGMGGSIGIFVGRQGQTIIKNNFIGFLQGEGGEGGLGVSNTFGNEDTIMQNNVFFSCTGGFYKYMDENKDNLLIWKNSEFEDLNDEDECESYMLTESGDNREEDAGLKPDKNFAGIFANFVGSSPGKLNMDFMNQWRRSVGLPLQAAAGTARQNYVPPYPWKAVIPGMQTKMDDVGAKADVEFASYKSKGTAEGPASYEEVSVSDFKKGAKYGKGNDGRPVMFQAAMGDLKMTYEIDEAPRTDHKCFQLIESGKMPPTRDHVWGYILKGTDADKKWKKYQKKAAKYNKKGGIWIYGRAYDFKNQNYAYPVGIVIDRVEKSKK